MEFLLRLEILDQEAPVLLNRKYLQIKKIQNKKAEKIKTEFWNQADLYIFNKALNSLAHHSLRPLTCHGPHFLAFLSLKTYLRTHILQK